MTRLTSAFEVYYLLAVHALQQKGEIAYGARVKDWIEAELHKEINVGQAYGTAIRLIDNGLLDAEECDHPSGKGKKVLAYSVTEFGRSTLRAAINACKA
jgi:hypothetical protein